jgi:hypothetical protein
MATAAVNGKRKGDRLWQRGLKNDRVETYAAIDDETFVHIIAPAGVTQELVEAVESATGKALPAAELRASRGRRRGPRPFPGQTQFEDIGEVPSA